MGLYHLSVDGCPIVQHVLDINQAAVEDGLDEIVRVMEINEDGHSLKKIIHNEEEHS